MRKFIFIIVLLLFTTLLFAKTAFVTGVLKNGGFFDSNYYYVELGSYSNKGSLQNQVFKAYSTHGGFGIWYENCSWILDKNSDGQHITIEPENVASGVSLNSLQGKRFSFSYEIDSQGVPQLTIFPTKKSWLVLLMTPQGGLLKSTQNSTLHTSVAYSYNYDGE
ncbi:MAG: hypothetical protein NTX05_02765 [Fusobacteria bacterium]|nr:hypothetical protein [Fusobacteriota bacterium]